MEANQNPTPDTNTPETFAVDIASFAKASGEPGPGLGSGSGENAEPAKPQGQEPEKVEPKPATPQGEPQAQPQPNAEAEPLQQRYDGAVKKLHEQAENSKRLEARLAQLETMLKTATQPNQTQQEVMNLLLQNLKKQNEPKPPTKEEINAEFTRRAADDPQEAIEWLMEQKLKGQQPQLTQEQVLQLINNQLQPVTMQTQIDRAETNLKALVGEKKIDQNQFEGFKKHLHRVYSAYGKPEMVGQAIHNVCQNKEQLSTMYDAYVLASNPAAVLNQVRDSTEAKVAEKLSQTPPKSANPVVDQQIKKMSELLVEQVGDEYARKFAF